MEEKAKKYIVEYCSGATGYGWRCQHDRLDEFEGFIDQMRREYTASVTVWDNEIEDFIFWKDVLTFDTRIDMLHDMNRDMRTKTRKYKA